MEGTVSTGRNIEYGKLHGLVLVGTGRNVEYGKLHGLVLVGTGRNVEYGGLGAKFRQKSRPHYHPGGSSTTNQGV